MSHSRRAAIGTSIAAALGVATLVGCRRAEDPGPEATASKDGGLWQSILQSKSIRVGFGGYPPFLSQDPGTKEMKGFSVALIKEVFDPLDIKVTWIQTSWATMRDDLLLGKFDLMVEPIIMTIPRSARVGFTRPYTYFGYAVVISRANDSRFKSISDLNNKDISVSVSQGVTDHEFALRNLPKANLKVVASNDIALVMNEVLFEKADAALVDLPSAKAFAQRHAGKVQIQFSNPPPAITPAGFMTKPREFEFINFLNNALLALESAGTIARLEDEYDVPTIRLPRSQAPAR